MPMVKRWATVVDDRMARLDHVNPCDTNMVENSAFEQDGVRLND